METLPLKDPSIDWDDLSFHKKLVCKNHPNNIFSTKNPWMRSIFVVTQDCTCPISDLLVIKEEKDA